MKLHLPLTLLAALMAVLTLHTATAETIEVNGTTYEIEGKSYTDGVQMSVTTGGIVNMSSASSIISGSSVINMDAGTFNMSAGSIAGGDGSSATISLRDSVFNLTTGNTAYIGNGRGAIVTLDLNDNGSFNHERGVLGNNGAITTVNINNGGSYNLSSGGTFSSFYKIYNSTTYRSEGTININNGGKLNLSGSAYLGYNGGNATVHVNEGGKFIQTGGMVGFGRLAEYGRVEVFVHNGGEYSMKAGAVAPTSGRARITVESGGLFNQYGNSTAGAEIASGSVVNQAYAEIVVQSGGIYNMAGGSVASNSSTTSKTIPQALILVSGQLNQTGGDIATGSGKALIVLQEGSTMTQSGGILGNNHGNAGLDIRRGSSFTLRGNGTITGNSELALGSAPTITVAPPIVRDMWDDVSPDAPAESGTYVFTQEGGTISGSVSITLIGADATFTQSGGTITDEVTISLSDGALFLQDENGDEAEISGSVSIGLTGSGTTFNQMDGAVTGGASLTLADGASFSQSGSGSFSGASLSATGSSTKLTQQGGSIDTQLSLSEGASFEQSGEGSIAGSISLSDTGTHFTQKGGSISASIELSNGATFDQEEGRVTGSISVIGEGSVYTQKGGSIGSSSSAADITLSEGGIFLQEGGTLFGDIILSDAGATFSQGGNIGGNVSVSGGANYTQQRTTSNVMGHVSVDGAGSTFSQQGSISSGAEVTGGGSLSQGSSSATISGGATVSGTGSTLSQQGLISGDVTVSNGGTLTQEGTDAAIDGNVSVEGGTLSQTGRIAGALQVTNGGSVTQSTADASIGGGATVSGSGSSLVQAGSITGNVTVSSGGSLSQTGSESSITGDVAVDGSGSLFTQQNAVSGSISVTNGARATQTDATATVGAGVSVNGAGSSFTQAGSVTGDVRVSNKGSYIQNAGISGSVTLSDATFTQGSSISQDVTLTDGATLTQTSPSASVSGSVWVDASTLNQVGSIDGKVTVTNKGRVIQSGSDAHIAADVTVSGGSFFTQTGSIDGAVSVSDSTFTQSGSIGGKVTVTNSSYTQSAAGSIAGDVEVSGAKSSFTQEGTLSGNLTLSDGASFKSYAAIAGSADISGKGSSFSHMAGTWENASISISDQATFTHEGGAITGDILLSNASFISKAEGMGANVTMSGTDATYNMGGKATTGNVTLNGGNLSAASQFDGKLYIDTAADYTAGISLGGVKADTIHQIYTRSATALLSDVGAGTLTIQADTENSMVVSSATSHVSGASAPSAYLITFAEGQQGTLSFADGATLVLNFSSDMLVEGKGLKDGEMSIYLTNGSLSVGSNPEDVMSHLNFGSAFDAEDIRFIRLNGGELVLRVNMDSIWVASVDGTQVSTEDIPTLSDSKMVVVDENMSINLSSDVNEVRLRQLIGDGSTYGNLTIAAASQASIELNNVHSDNASNGNTVFNGNLTVNGAGASDSTIRKTGDAALTLGGTLSTPGALSLEEGTLNLYGKGNKVKSLNMSADTALSITKDLTLAGGESDVTSGTLSGGGMLTIQGGSLNLSNSDMEVSLTLRSGARVVQYSGSINGNVILEANGVFELDASSNASAAIHGDVTLGKSARMDARKITGTTLLSGENAVLNVSDSVADVTLSGKGASLTITGSSSTATGSLSLIGENSSVILGALDNIDGDVLISGKGAHLTTGGNADVIGSVVVSGEKAELDQIRDVSKSLTLSGAGARVELVNIADSAEVSGKGASLTATGITKNLTLSGEKATANVGNVQGTVEISGAGAALSDLETAGALIVSGEDAVVTGDFTVSGNVVISGDGATVGKMSTDASGERISVTLSGQEAKLSAGSLSNVALDISGAGAELSVETLSQATISLSGIGAVLNLCGAAADASSGLTMTEGELQNAGNYAGSAIIDIAAEFSGSSLKLGGLKGESITSLNLRKGVSITGLGADSLLTLSGYSIITIGQQSIATGTGAQAEQAALVFDNATGTIQIEGQVKLAFAPEVMQDFSSGTFTLWFTNGSVAELKDLTETADIVSWLEQHFLLETGSGLSVSAFSGSEDEGGKITISAALDKIWQTSQDAPSDHTVTDPGELGSYTQVVVDRDTHLNVAVDEDTTTTIKQIHGDSHLTISNTGSGELTVELRNEDFLGYYGETTFGGDITVNTDHVTLEKVGNADLTLNGNLQTPNDVQVRNGKLILNGEENTVRSISFLPEDTDEVTDRALVVNDKLTLTGSSDLSGQTGSISGSGLLVLQGELKPGEYVSLSGPSVHLESAGSLNLDGAAPATVGGLSGSGALNLGTDGSLVITGGSGEFSGSLQGAGSLTITGRGTEQTLAGSGNAAYAVENGTNSTLVLKNDGVTNFRSLVSGGELRIQAGNDAQPTARLYTAEGIHLKASSTTMLYINFDSPTSINTGAPILESAGNVIIEGGSRLVIDGEGAMAHEDLEFVLIKGAKLYDDPTATLAGDDPAEIAEGAELSNVELNGLFSLFYEDARVIVNDKHEAVFTATYRRDNFYNLENATYNSAAGATLLWAARETLSSNSLLRDVSRSVVDMINAGDTARASRTMAALAGSTLPALGNAQRDALREQSLRMRDHSIRPLAHSDEKSPRVHAWIEASGSYAKQNSDGDETGYKLNSWGGSVGADTALSQNISLGLAITALYGDLDAEAAESASGKLDTWYLNLYLHARQGKWGHTLVLSYGMSSAELDRTVDYGAGSYQTHGSTDGSGFGALYELTYDVPLNAENSSVLQPLISVSLLSTSMKGFDESGADGANLSVGDQKWSSGSVGLGARWLGLVGAHALGRAAGVELRAELAQDFGDSRGETNVALLSNPAQRVNVRGAEVGSTGFRLGAGACLPVSQKTQVYLNGNADLRSGATSWYLNMGVRYGF